MAFVRKYENDAEEQQQLHAIQQLARELNVREEDIRALYEDLFSRIAQKATIREYLSVLVSREVKHSIRDGARTRKLTESRRDLSAVTPELLVQPDRTNGSARSTT